MKIHELLEGLNYEKSAIADDINIEQVCFSSADVVEESLFIAIKGNSVDGHNFINEALQKGAVAIICEYIPVNLPADKTFILVKDSSEALGVICSNFFGKPSSKIRLVGVTGTNGKTTIASLLYQLFQNLGFKTGLISTICNKIHQAEIPSSHTTPNPYMLNKLLGEMVSAGCDYCFMEVSSHAVVQKRITGLRFSGGIFSNITHDHLDYHKTFDNYLNAKKGFFDLLTTEAFSLSNIDDKQGEYITSKSNASKYSYSLYKMADFKTKIIESHFDGTLLKINNDEVWSNLVGRFNAYNLTAIYGAAVLCGIDKNVVIRELSKLRSAEGRFDVSTDSNKVRIIIDYAHTPDALQNVLATISDIRKLPSKIITVTGAGGNRDKTKRPEMARIVALMSDQVVLTSDNPRNEDVSEIIEDMKKGLSDELMKKVLTITDRKEAIRTAYTLAKPEDIILIAGKGHEKYQEINGVKYPFDDKKIINELMNK